MPVLEVCLLRVREGTSASDESLLRSLATVRSRIKTNSQFYHSIEDPSLIYILGIWPSLEAHHRFLDSPEKQEILAPQEHQLEFVWMVHVPLESMPALPLDAPLMSIARVFLKAEKPDAYDTAEESYTQAVREASKPYRVVQAERCDPNLTQPEVLVITGWNSVEDHGNFLATVGDNRDLDVVRERFAGLEARHARNMERAS